MMHTHPASRRFVGSSIYSLRVGVILAVGSLAISACDDVRQKSNHDGTICVHSTCNIKKSDPTSPPHTSTVSIDSCLPGLWKYEGAGGEVDATADPQGNFAQVQADVAMKFNPDGTGTFEGKISTVIDEDGQRREVIMDGIRSFIVRAERGAIEFGHQQGGFDVAVYVDGEKVEETKEDIPLHSGSYACHGDKLTLAPVGDRKFEMARVATTL
ncbi:hypothetical protein ACICHK_26870 [Streptomyces sp. AHU1]|uniref:hypothetical protein n=1 Tax=Streptomyces sp. AHU1 TaxID=3377215 RepID=UPI003877C887